MNNKTLGTLALIGAPFLCIGMNIELNYLPLKDTWFTGLWGILYMTPWMGSIVALQRMKAAGESLFGRRLLQVILLTLTIANISNLWRLLMPFEEMPSWFLYVDLFWPLSNTIMLVVGITVLVANVLKGWMRFVPLAVGCWLPFSLCVVALFGQQPITFLLSGVYSAFGWTALAIVVLHSDRNSMKNTGLRYRFS